MLKLLVGVVDAELLETIDLERLEAVDVEDADEAMGLGRTLERLVDLAHDPVEELRV